MGSKVTNRKVWEDVLSVMRIRTFQIIVLQVRLESRNPDSHLSWPHIQRPGMTTSADAPVAVSCQEADGQLKPEQVLKSWYVEGGCGQCRALWKACHGMSCYSLRSGGSCSTSTDLQLPKGAAACLSKHANCAGDCREHAVDRNSVHHTVASSCWASAETDIMD